MKIENDYTASCVGREMPSYSTLKSMTKDQLIELLGIAQHNYNAVVGAYSNTRRVNQKMYQEAVEMKHGLQKLANMNYEDCKGCPQFDTAACMKEQIDKLEFKCLKAKSNNDLKN